MGSIVVDSIRGAWRGGSYRRSRLCIVKYLKNTFIFWNVRTSLKRWSAENARKDSPRSPKIFYRVANGQLMQNWSSYMKLWEWVTSEGEDRAIAQLTLQKL